MMVFLRCILYRKVSKVSKGNEKNAQEGLYWKENPWELFRKSAKGKFGKICEIIGNRQLVVRIRGGNIFKNNFEYFTMEFPPDSFEVFPAEDFETASARGGGKAAVDLFLQARANGRCIDHFRLVLGGSSILEANVPLTRVFNAPSLSDYKLQFQFWARDVKIRRNMTTSVWSDAYAGT